MTTLRTPRKTYRDLKDIASIPVPDPTETYCPVSQEELWERVRQAFTFHGYKTSNDLHQVHRKRPLFLSSMEVSHVNLPEQGGSMTWTVAVMNSYDKTCSARIIFGGKVFVCSNGLIVADHILRTKHTTHVWDRLPVLISKAVDSFYDEVNGYHDQQERLKEVTVGTNDLSAFTIRLAQRGILPKSQMLDFYEESVAPQFDYQTKSMCLWNFQAAYTHLAKTMNPVERPGRVMAFDEMLRKDFDYALT